MAWVGLPFDKDDNGMADDEINPAKKRMKLMATVIFKVFIALIFLWFFNWFR